MFSIIILFLCAMSSRYYADEAIIIDSSGRVRSADPTPTPPKDNKAKISVDFQNADIHAVMRFLAHTGNTNILLDDHVQGTITMRLEGVPWEDAFAAVLWSKGLMATTMPSLLLVSPMQSNKSK